MRLFNCLKQSARIGLGLISLVVACPESWAVTEGGSEANPFTVYYDEGPHTAAPGASLSFEVLFSIPEEYYLYAEKMNLLVKEASGVTPGTLLKPEGSTKEDPFFGKSVPVFYDEVVLTLPLTLPLQNWIGLKEVKGEIEFQGCSKELCYRLMRVPFTLQFRSSLAVAKPNVPQTPISAHDDAQAGFFEVVRQALTANDFNLILERGFWIALLVCFLGGFLTDFTPCVWPMIPVTLAIVGVRKDRTLMQNFVSVFVLVIGMSVMYSLLGIIAALLGQSLGFLFQNIVFLLMIDLLLVAMALSLLGFFNIQLPSNLQVKLSRISGSGYRGIFLIGLTMGLMAAPCVGPIVGPLLVFAAQTQDVGIAFVFLLSYALGMGIIFLVLGTFYGVMRVRLKSGPWMEWFKRLLGAVLLVVALYYAHTILVRYGSNGSASPDNQWLSSLDEGLQKASDQHKPMIIDFFALWCLPCIELDHQVWERGEMIDKLQQEWIAVKIDCTEQTPQCERAVDKFQVIGWPTVVFLKADQTEAISERLVGRVVSLEEMIKIMERVEKP